MAAFLPLLTLVFIFMALAARARAAQDSGRDGWRTCWLTACALWGAGLIFVTQALSVLDAIRFPVVLVGWSMAAVLSGVWCVRNLRRGGLAPPRWRDIPWFSWALVAGMAAIALTVALVALVAPPNNWDSMVYHMSRVMHWIQNGNVAFIPTHILRQNHQNPGSETIILHLQLLAGGDRFANMVQWMSMAGCVVGSSLIARLLGSRVRGQVFAAVMSLTIPMGILQTTSTESDYVVAFWLVCFVAFVVQMVVSRRVRPLWAVAAGCALGLAVLTKATSYIIALPFLIWLIVELLRVHRVRGLKWLIAIGCLAFALNTFHYGRNIGLYDHPLGPGKESEAFVYANTAMSPALFASNVVRNVGLHVGLPRPEKYAFAAGWNAFFEKTILGFHEAIGVDPGNPDISWAGTTFHVQAPIFNDEIDGNLAQLLLIALALGLFPFFRRTRSKGLLWIYIAGVLAGFFLFCFYLRWQPWHSRLHIAMFVLAAPFVGVIFSRTFNWRVVNALAALLLLLAVPWVIGNSQRSLIGPNHIFSKPRLEQYFSAPLGIRDPYFAVAEKLRESGCRRIGLYSDIECWEYPLWMVLREELGEDFELRHVNLANVSKAIEEKEPFSVFDPDAIVSAGVPKMDAMPFKGVDYPNRLSVGKVNLYLRPM